MRKAAWVLAVVMLLTGCGSRQVQQEEPFGLGEVVSTAWFDYAVDSVMSVEEYEGVAAAQGEQLIVVGLTLENTYTQSVPLFDGDFQLFWSGRVADDTRCMPVAPFCEQQLPDEYELEPKESRSGVLIYRIPQQVQEVELVFQEVFDDGTPEGRPGEQYLVQLTVQS